MPIFTVDLSILILQTFRTANHTQHESFPPIPEHFDPFSDRFMTVSRLANSKILMKRSKTLKKRSQTVKICNALE